MPETKRESLEQPDINETPYRDVPELYNLEDDISEKRNLKDAYPEDVKELLDLAEKNRIEPDPNTRIGATPR
jgi:hypothetical protein